MQTIDSIDSFQFLEQEIINSLNCIEEYLAIYGGIHLVKSAFKFTKIFKLIYLLAKRRVNLKNFGSYAVISSIEQSWGKEIALNLAEKGINLILLIVDENNEESKQFLSFLSTKNIEIITLNREQLNSCCNRIDEKDATDKMNQTSQTDILSKILKKDIGILIYCSNYQPKQPKKFLSFSDLEINQLIETNIIIPVKLHRLFLKRLLDRERGMILNVNSLTTIRAIPYYSLYSASQRLIEQLLDSMSHEYGEHNHILFKTLIDSHLASYLLNTKSITDLKSKDEADRSVSIFKRLLIEVLPNKQKFISKLLESNYSFKTTGHWLFELEFYLIDYLPQFALNLMVEYLAN